VEFALADHCERWRGVLSFDSRRVGRPQHRKPRCGERRRVAGSARHSDRNNVASVSGSKCSKTSWNKLPLHYRQRMAVHAGNPRNENPTLIPTRCPPSLVSADGRNRRGHDNHRVPLTATVCCESTAPPHRIAQLDGDSSCDMTQQYVGQHSSTTRSVARGGD
jgi:hypothetical protein